MNAPQQLADKILEERIRKRIALRISIMPQMIVPAIELLKGGDNARDTTSVVEVAQDLTNRILDKLEAYL